MSSSSASDRLSGVKKNVKSIKLSRPAIESIKTILNEIESSHGVNAQNLLHRLQIHERKTKENEHTCIYFKNDGTACSRPRYQSSLFCYCHRNCADKYANLAQFFKKRFAEEADEISNDIDFGNLSIVEKLSPHIEYKI